MTARAGAGRSDSSSPTTAPSRSATSIRPERTAAPREYSLKNSAMPLATSAGGRTPAYASCHAATPTARRAGTSAGTAGRISTPPAVTPPRGPGRCGGGRRPRRSAASLPRPGPACRGRPNAVPGNSAAPVAMNASSSTTTPLRCACGPTTTWRPIRAGWLARPRISALSMTIDCAPSSTGPPSSVSTAPNRTRQSGPTRTSPLSTAVGATHAVGSTCGRRPSCSTTTTARSLLAVGELPLEDLAGRVARQLVDEDDVARDLVAREVRLDVVPELVLRRRPARLDDDERAQPLAELLVLDADDGHLADRRVAGEQVLDLAREHVLAARDDHLVVATGDEQAAVLVEVADVARGHQARDDLLAAAAGVLLHRHLVADEDTAGLAGRHLPAVLVEQLHDGAARRAAGGARRLAQVLRRRDC